ncbi:thioredoxin [Aurantibacter aestuarii]|uniref:Thioredoxin n=2 Tax=Aurantibacter aestuarii TaxID=1266046 RepID=A0A2T1N4S7_9FLAO|nr:thioredoxin [Aurantibacter aestuarii]PSG86292.1 thioredoxin [Aurantibacter aestuarii]
MSTFSELINKEQPVLVDFYADWCGPCQTMMPILEEVKKELGDAVSIIKINIDKNQNIATRFQVRGVPTFMLYKNGEQVWRQSGLVQKAELIQTLKKFQ